MELDTLLGGKTDCECGRAHICGIKHIKIGEGALGALPGLLKVFTRVAAVSDTNTYYVCGAKVTDMIGEKLFSETVLGSPEKRLVPNENTLAQLKANSIGADIIVVYTWYSVHNSMHRSVHGRLRLKRRRANS